MKKKKKEDSKNLTKKRNKIIKEFKKNDNKENYEDIVIKKYKTDSKYQNNFNDLLSINNNSTMEKCNHSKCDITKEWSINKNNDKTPKSDVIIKDSKKIIKISLKKNKGSNFLWVK